MEQLRQLLKCLSITHLISVDDENASSVDVSMYDSIDLSSTIITSAPCLSPEDITQLDDSGALTLGEVKSSLPDIYSKLTNFLSSKSEVPSALSFVNEVFASIESPAFISLSSFSIECIPEECGKVLWFLDKEMNGQNILSTTIPSIMDLKFGTHIIMLLTSDQGLQELNKSWTDRFQYLHSTLGDQYRKQAEEAAYCFYVLTKSEIESLLSKDKKDRAQKKLCQRITDALIGFSAYHICEQLRSFTSTAEQRLIEIARNLSQESLSTLNYNMTFEGYGNVYRAFRDIQSCFLEKEYIKSFSKCSSYISAMKKMQSFPDTSRTAFKTNIINFLQCYDWTKYQLLQTDCNNAFLDVSYGDLFRIKTRTHYAIGILISQSCDCVIRNIKRKKDTFVGRNASMFSLLLYPEKELEIKSALSDYDPTADDIKDLRESSIIYSLERINSTHHIVKYILVKGTSAKLIQLNPFILDLTSLNSDGTATICDVSDIIKREKTKIWSEYASSCQTQVTQATDRIKLLQENLGEHSADIIEDLYSVPFDFEANQFCIQRIGRLNSNLVELAYREFLSHSYRVGRAPINALQIDI